MSAPYKILIGLETHVQLHTKTKLFCGCATTFGSPPNSQTCPVCIAMPGVLPVMNRRAFELSLKTALSLGCQIAKFTKWDRKNYYYPDLPKNYQISQYDLPFALGGHVTIQTPVGEKQVGLIRVHLEEDAGKNTHSETGGDSLVDLNRAGTPLLEIVSEPQMNEPAEAHAYLDTLRTLLLDLGVSDCEMQEGSLRCDANVNLHIEHEGRIHKTPIVEVKNMNSMRAVERAIAHEAERQYESWLRDKKELGSSPKQTRGWDDVKGVTRSQREKEESSDYRYFPEPDLSPVVVSEELLDRIRAEIGENSGQRKARYQTALGLSEYNADVLVTKGRAVWEYFEDLVGLGLEAKSAANWLINDVLAHATGRVKVKSDLPLEPPRLAELVRLVADGKLNLNDAREKVLPKMLETKQPAGELVSQLGLEVVADTSLIEQVADDVIRDMAQAAADVRAGKTKALGALVGQCMKRSGGKFPPALVNQILLKKLGA